MTTYTISLETHPEPDHIATFPETKIDLEGNESACFELCKNGKDNKRLLSCTFEDNDDEDENGSGQEKTNVTYVSQSQRISTNGGLHHVSTNEPTYCILYIDKATGTATLRPAMVHNLVSEKENILSNLESKIMSEKQLNDTIETDSRTNLQKRTDYTTNFGSKVQQNTLKNENILRAGVEDNYVSDLVMKKLGKAQGDSKFHGSEGESATCPTRDVNAKKVDKVYIFKNLLPEEVIDDLSYHAESCLGEVLGKKFTNFSTKNYFSIFFRFFFQKNPLPQKTTILSSAPTTAKSFLSYTTSPSQPKFP